jgi:hypothetical protein
MTATKTTNSYVELRKAMEENASDIEIWFLQEVEQSVFVIWVSLR